MSSALVPIEVPTTGATNHDELRECVGFAVSMGRQLCERLRDADFRLFESLDAETAVGMMLQRSSKQVYRAIGDVMQLIANLPYLLLDEQVGPIEDDDGFDIDALDDAFNFDNDAIEGQPPEPLRDGFDEEIDAALQQLSGIAPADPQSNAAMWRTALDELGRARERIQDANRQRSKWAMITAGEDGKRRAIKALEFALTLAVQTVDPEHNEPILPDTRTLLESSLTVRATLLEFRRDVLELTADLDHRTDAEMLDLMRALCLRFTELFYAPAYEEVRAADRFQLHSLHQRIGQWIDDGAGQPTVAREICRDVSAFVELLFNINRRVVLVEHDRRLLARCRDELAALAELLRIGHTDVVRARYTDALLQLEILAWRAPAAGEHTSTELRDTSIDQLELRIEATRALAADISI